MVSFHQIEELARKIGAEYHPQRILLFGSYARGTAQEDSDVDMLVILPFEGRSAEKSVEMRLKLDTSLPIDLLVRTPQTIQQRLKMGDFFIEDILREGKVLYEAAHN
jgi:predicted nucleotidyltransferase